MAHDDALAELDEQFTQEKQSRLERMLMDTIQHFAFYQPISQVDVAIVLERLADWYYESPGAERFALADESESEE